MLKKQKNAEKINSISTIMIVISYMIICIINITIIFIVMGRWEQVLVLEVECAKDKNAETPGGKYRRDTPWLVEAFRKKVLTTIWPDLNKYVLEPNGVYTI